MPMLSRREVSLLDSARRLKAALAFQEQLHPFPAAQTTYGSGISSQCSLLLTLARPWTACAPPWTADLNSSSFRRPTPVVRDRRGIANGANFDAGGLERAN